MTGSWYFKGSKTQEELVMHLIHSSYNHVEHNSPKHVNEL